MLHRKLRLERSGISVVLDLDRSIFKSTLNLVVEFQSQFIQRAINEIEMIMDETKALLK